jgi:hypothetical protein
MAEIINLNKVRKARARAAAVEQAALNRVRHGRTAPERKLDREAAASVRKVTDGARLEESDRPRRRRSAAPVEPKSGPATEG